MTPSFIFFQFLQFSQETNSRDGIEKIHTGVIAVFLDFFDVVLGERGRCSAHGDLQEGKGGEIGWWLTSMGARKTVTLPFEEKSGTSARFKAPAEDSVSS